MRSHDWFALLAGILVWVYPLWCLGVVLSPYYEMFAYLRAAVNPLVIPCELGWLVLSIADDPTFDVWRPLASALNIAVFLLYDHFDDDDDDERRRRLRQRIYATVRAVSGRLVVVPTPAAP